MRPLRALPMMAITGLLVGCSTDSMPLNGLAVSPAAKIASNSVTTGLAEASFVCEATSLGSGPHGWRYLGSSAFLSDRDGERLGFVQLRLVLAAPESSALVVTPRDQRLHQISDLGAGKRLRQHGVTHVRRANQDGPLPPRAACGPATSGRIEVRPYTATFVLVSLS
jgi:hypothetical protein